MSMEARRYINNDMRRITMVMERVASDAGDEFLSYLFGMAVLHLNEPEKEKNRRRRMPVSQEIDPRIGKLAKELLASVKPEVR